MKYVSQVIIFLIIIQLLELTACSELGNDFPIDFTRYTGITEDPNVEDPANNLCMVPYDKTDAESVQDKVFIECDIEGGNFSDVSMDHPYPDTLRVVVWNMERGLRLEDQITFLQNHPSFMEADIYLLQEVDRGCLRTNNQNIPRELAKAFNQNYVFAVEFVELDPDDTLGEHGNAIMSRYPIGNIQTLRHTPLDPLGWWSSETEPRLGGRIALYADVLIGNRIIKLVSLHLESGGGPDHRGLQAQEAIDYIGDYHGPAVLGGDLNTALLDYEANAHHVVMNAGYKDAFEGLSFEETYTHSGTIDLRLDWGFVRGLKVMDQIVPHEIADDHLSDHLPLAFDIDY